MSTKLYSATALALACQLLFSVPAAAQSAEPAGKAGSSAGLSDAERARRDADKVLQWIKFHATHSNKPDAPAPAPTPAPAARPVQANRSAPAPRPSLAAATATPVASAASAAQPSLAAASVPAPAASQDSQLVAAQEPATVASQAQQLAAAPEPGGAATATTEPQLMAAAAATPTAPPPTEPTRTAPQPEPDDEVELRLVQKVDPEIPRQLASSIRSGSVMVRFQVKPDGTTNKVETVGSANKRLAASALAAVRQWKFAPIPKPRDATVEIGFKLD